MDKDNINLKKFISILEKSRAVIIDESSSPEVFEIDSKDLVQLINENSQELKKMGVTKGKKVIIATGNNIAFMVSFFSCLTLEAVPIPLTSLCTQSYLEQVIHLTAPALIITNNYKGSVINGLQYDSVQQSKIGLNDVSYICIKGAKQEETLDHHVIIMSSGTTGRPKAILHNFNSLLLNSFMHIESIGMTKEDNVLQMLPMNYSYGLVANMLASLISQCAYIIAESPFCIGNFHKLCERYQVTLVGSTPYNMKRILSMKKAMPSSIQKITIGGDFSGSQLIEELYMYYSNQVYLTYGLSEAGPRVFTNKLMKENPAEWEYLGCAMPNIKIKLDEVTKTGNIEVGQLLIDSPTNMIGYYALDGTLDRSCFMQGWLKSGDNVAHDLTTGKITFLNRVKNIIVSGGEKLMPGYIRQMICEHPLVDDVYVYPQQDALLGEVPFAEIVLKIEATNEEVMIHELKAWCKKRLRRIEVPKEMKIVNQLTCKLK